MKERKTIINRNKVFQIVMKSEDEIIRMSIYVYIKSEVKKRNHQ